MTLLGACVWMFASVYSVPQATSSGEWFDGKKLTMALRDSTDPWGTWYFVSYKDKTVTVRYTDKGPFKNKPRRRDADLADNVAKLLNFPGLGFICVQRIG